MTALILQPDQLISPCNFKKNMFLHDKLRRKLDRIKLLAHKKVLLAFNDNLS